MVEPAEKTMESGLRNRIRDIIAIITVTGYVGITALLAIVFPLYGLAAPADLIAYLKDVSGLYSGIVGVIIGFYFGRQ